MRSRNKRGDVVSPTVSRIESITVAPSGALSATPAEAAAIAAAIQRFQADTAIAAPPEDTAMDPWSKAALIEGVSAKSAFGPGDPSDPF